MHLRSQEEEIVNAYTHLLWCLFSVVYFFTYILTTNIPSKFVVSSLLMIGLSSWTFFSSYWYHSTCGRKKSQNREIDKTSIFLMITGCGSSLNMSLVDPTASLVCTTIMLFSGFFLTFLYVYLKKPTEIFSITSYILLGWYCILPITGLFGENVYNLSSSVWSIIGGGIAYTIGLLFYAKDSIKWNHTIWHLCVMVGYILHLHGHFKVVKFVSISSL